MERIPPSLGGASSPRIPSRPGIGQRIGGLLPRLLHRQRHYIVHARASQGEGVDGCVVVEVAASEPDGPHVVCVFLGAGEQEDGFAAHARISPA
ncbi:MAG: hypothetical protein ACWGQW_19315 [bacterium]